MNYIMNLTILVLIGNFMNLYADPDPNCVLSREVIKRSIVSSGDQSRLNRVFEKAQRGEPVTVGVIGGSITEGAMASCADYKWANRVAKWWRDSFGLVKVWTFVNAGLGATGSNIASHRAGDDLLRYKPDFVIVEFAVNDFGQVDSQETLEGLLRQILKLPNQPAVLLLFTMFNDGRNCQDLQTMIGNHYGLPMISYRDALWPEIEAGRLKWQDIAADYVHPNDTGHKYCAELINSFLNESLMKLPENRDAIEIKAMPSTLTNDLYEYTSLLNYDRIKPSFNKGWHLLKNGRFGSGWYSEIPGSVIEFDIDARAVALSFFRIKRDMGIAEVQIDQSQPIKMNAHFDQTWGGYNVWQPIEKSAAKHKRQVRVKLLDEKDPNSNGHRFEINALFLAGVRND